MSITEEQTCKPRKVLNIFYVLDTSGSMAGSGMSMLDTAMEETVDVLKKEAETNADAELKIAVLEYNSSCNWVTPNGPEDIKDFFWKPLNAGGITELGLALKELNSKLSKDEFLNSTTDIFLPIIIFVTDGTPTDDYMKELEEIRKNKWYHKATKIGYALGDDADVETLAQVVGNIEAVIASSDLKVFPRLIKFSAPVEDVQGKDSVK